MTLAMILAALINSLKHLRGLTTLKYLDLYDTHISDVGLAHLAGLERLEHLQLGHTHVTDAGPNSSRAI